MSAQTKQFTYRAILAVGIVFIIFFSFFVGGAGTARAADSAYTDVIEDLQKDEAFTLDDYPTIAGDYSLQVKQIAESSAGELFIYVYQPGGESERYNATSINISTAINDSLKYENYNLTLINSHGVFYKYKVMDFELKKTALRYYDITSIYRKWNNSVDGKPENGEGNEKAYAVGQLWTAATVNGDVTYTCEDIEVIQVTQQMVGARRYSNGLSWSSIEHCDAHYIAFSCDHAIDKLLSADIGFYTQTYTRLAGQDPKFNDDKEKHYKTVNCDDPGASSGKKSWQRMSSTREFVDELGVTGETKDSFLKYDWIINFYETEYQDEFGGKDFLICAFVPGGFIWSIVNACTTSGTQVSEVTLMRLEFEYNGKVYNLGVVSDKQTGDVKPADPIFGDDDNWLDKIVRFVLIISVVAIFFVIVKLVISTSKK